MSFASGDFVKVLNRGDKAVRLAWDNRPYDAAPEKETIVPVEAAIHALGDPRSGPLMRSSSSNGRVEWVPDRQTEIRRLKAWYSNQDGDESQVFNAPTIEVYTLDGERLTTVLEDPLGETVTASNQTLSEREELRDIIQRQQDQIDLLMNRSKFDELIDDDVTETPTRPNADQEDLPTDESPTQGVPTPTIGNPRSKFPIVDRS